jgi:hypothetical protein
MSSINDEPSKDIDGEDESAEMEDDEDAEMEEPEMDDDLPSMDGMDMPTGDDDMLDMTGASDEEVLKVFKAMSDEDGIVVKKDGNNIELSDDGDEYIIKLDESEDAYDETDDEEVSEEYEEEEMAEEDETVYEIDLGDDDDEEEAPEEEMGEAARTKWNAHGGVRTGLKSKKLFAAGAKNESKSSSAINEQVETLKKQNQEYKKALVLFKDKLNEVAVFNANLAHATRLFTEHSTTKTEKLEILKRFDTVSTINESKNLFTSIRAELETKKPVTESMAGKISSSPSTSSSQEMLSESKAYEAPQFRRMRDLMSKLK